VAWGEGEFERNEWNNIGKTNPIERDIDSVVTLPRPVAPVPNEQQLPPWVTLLRMETGHTE
jgi:hypothetical protein